MSDDTDAIDDEYDDDDDGFCLSCGDTFRYDDCGGYNPPCSCGWHCRHCHEREADREDGYDDYDDHDPAPPDALEIEPREPLK